MGLIPQFNQWFVVVGIAATFSVLQWSDQGFAQDTGKLGSLGDETQQHKTPSILKLSLKESIMLALENNLDVQVDKLNKDVRLTDIVFELAKFDSTLGANFNHEQRAFPLNSTIDPITFQETEETPLSQVSGQDFGVDVQKRLQTGADIRVGIENERTDLLFFNHSPGGRLDPEYRSNVSVSIAQPLLRDFGIDINETFINVAKNNMAIEEYVFEGELMELVEDVTDSYWDLVLSIELLKVEQESVRAAQSLLEHNRAQVEAGVLPSIEILVAEADVASREEDVLVMAQTIEDDEDELRRLMNLPHVPLVEKLTVIPVDLPRLTTEQIPLQDAIEMAFQKRPDIKERKRDLTNRGLEVDHAKNQLLPDLSFQGGMGLFGLGEDFGDDLNGVRNVDSFHYQAGLVLSVPLGNRSAKSTYNKRRIEAETALLTLKNLELDITVEVKKALRDINTDLKRIKVAQLSTKLAQRKAKEEEQRYKAGLSTSHDVLMFQRDLAEAQGREIEAIIDFNKALVYAQHVLGTILEDADITMA
tara:strand:+ start:2913 stop:4508 length:1596 start_codon:yes stop_codon:yes gene_type:complete